MGVDPLCGTPVIFQNHSPPGSEDCRPGHAADARNANGLKTVSHCKTKIVGRKSLSICLSQSHSEACVDLCGSHYSHDMSCALLQVDMTSLVVMNLHSFIYHMRGFSKHETQINGYFLHSLLTADNFS